MGAATRPAFSTLVGKILLVLLLCAACSPTQSLAFAQQAWAVEGNGAGYLVYYENADKQGYTLVLQNSDQQDARYGKKVHSASFSNPYDSSNVDTALNIDKLTFGDLSFSGLEDYLDSNDTKPDLSGPLAQDKMLRTIESHVTRVIMRDSLTAPNSMFAWFSDFWRCTSIDLSKLDTSQVTDMTAAFMGCLSLSQLNISNFNTSQVRGMGQMFSECRSLKHVDVSSFDTSSATTMQAMFYNAGIEELDAHNFTGTSLDPDEALNPDYGWDTMDMFSGCKKLKSLNLSGFAVRSDCDTWGMFENCNSLCHIVLSPQASQPFGKELPEKEWRHESGEVFTPKTIPAQLGGVYVTSEYVPPAPEPTTPPTSKPTTPPSTLVKPVQPTSLAAAQVTISSKAYTSKTLKPSKVTVKVGGKTLVQGRDFTVSCKGGKAVGSYKVTIKGKGNYTGTRTATFKILPKGTSVSKAKAAKRGFTVAWKKPSKTALKQTTGYKVQWSTDKKFKKAVKSKLIKKSKTASLKVSKLKGGKRYYVRVCTYKKVGGKYYYSSWSKAKAVKTKK